MRTLIVLHLIMLVAISACRESKLDPIPGFIPGTYIRYTEHEFGHEFDTLVIHRHSDLYTIERRWKYERILDGQPIEPEYKRTITTGIWNKGILAEQQTGTYYSFDPKQNCLFSGETRYIKR
jgi:hypothetical protein